MDIVRKLSTALKLAGRMDWETVQARWRINLAEGRIRRKGARPFLHRELGFPFVCHPDWPDSIDQYRNNAGDHWEFKLLSRWLEEGDTVLDVGANLGLYSFAAAAAVGSSGRVVAVEAAPYVVQKLEEAVQLAGSTQVKVLHAAVTKETGIVTFYVREDQFVTGEQSLHPSEAQRVCSAEVRVPSISLLDLEQELRLGTSLTLVKIDIEGAEGLAMESLPLEWLSADGPLWIVEINPSALARFGYAPADIVRHFSSNVFSCWLLAKHPLGPQTAPSLRQLTEGITYDDSLYYNFFAIPHGSSWAARVERIEKFFPNHA